VEASDFYEGQRVFWDFPGSTSHDVRGTVERGCEGKLVVEWDDGLSGYLSVIQPLHRLRPLSILDLIEESLRDPAGVEERGTNNSGLAGAHGQHNAERHDGHQLKGDG
jgi:hypothetical protein